MKNFKWVFFVMLWAVTLHAEMRMWTAEDGTRFLGEFCRELLGKIQIRDTEGNKRLIPIDQLSAGDLLYVETRIVSEIDITVRKKHRIRPPMLWTIPGDQTKLYTFTVTLDKKRSRLDSKVKLTVELYAIAKERDGNNWVLLDRKVSKFVFPEGRDSEYRFVVEDIPCRKYQATWADDGFGGQELNRGVTYLGYIVLVLDPKGEIVASDTDLSSESWMDVGIPDAVEKLRKLYIEGRGSQYSRHFNEEIRKTRVPQLPFYKRRKVFW